jgi:hypothetical protein
MSTLMMPAATMTTMTNTAPIAVTQPKIGSDQAAKMVGMITNNNRQVAGKTGKQFHSILLQKPFNTRMEVDTSYICIAWPNSSGLT